MGEEVQQIRVLVVDDHDMFAEALRGVLAEQHDVEVVAMVGTIAAALDAASAHRPDVVIMDRALPDGDGIDAIVALLAEHSGASVLVLTGDLDPRSVLRAIEVGAMGYLTKGRAIADLLAAVRALGAGEAYLPGDLLSAVLPMVGRSQRSIGRDLTAREVEVLGLAAAGLTNAAIATELGVSVNTVRNHVQSAITKLGAHSKLEAVSIALREHIVRLPDA